MTEPRPTTPAAHQYAEAVGALNRADWKSAQRIAISMLQRFGEHPGVHFVAGVAALELRQLLPARTHLSRAVAMNAQRADYLTYLAKALALSGDFQAAAAAADRACALSPEDPSLLDTLGVVYTESGLHGAAAAAFAKVVARAPGRAGSRFNHATALLYSGQIDRAEQEYEACLAVDERQWKAYTALSGLRKLRPEKNHIARFEAVLGKHANLAEARLYLHLALAKEQEDLGNYPAAFAHYVQGKAAGAEGRPYSRQAEEALFAAVAAAFPGPLAVSPGYDSEEPIFVVGMPRSGTTLVDRILSSHSQVTSAGELHHLSIAVKRASGSSTRAPLDADTLVRSAGIDWPALGKAYVESTRPITGSRPRFVDKLPHNFLYIGQILHALPRARVVLMRRNPMDSCLSNFRQLFALSSPFTRYSFNLLDTGHYFVQFDRLMRHWMEAFPGRVLQLSYEDLVLEQEATTRALLAYCGLPWEQSCLQFERNAAPTATASVVQVREPMQRGYLDRWQRYAPQLTGLRDYLRAEGIAVD
ncbi:MAG TPA: sulfotransferase [Stenotrophomonas sp.]|nr:sulfotransferase [Stenotrophomonas sp.]